MRLDLPRQIIEEDDSRKSKNVQKRQKIVFDDVYFDLKFPSVADIKNYRRS